VIGVSVDPPEMLRDFASSLKVPFAMVSDGDRSISRSYGVLWPLVGLDRRVTVLIDPEGVVRGVFDHEVLVGKHVDDALEALRRLPRSSTSGA
jgi:peroxiredoxin